MAHDLPWFPVYATETLADERYQGWTCEERGAWFSLLLMCWHEGSIPADLDQLRRLLHLDGPTFSTVWQAIGGRFVSSEDLPDRLVSPRQEIEREKARRIVRERAKAGSKGGKAKALRSLKPPSNCQANAKQTPSNALANPAHTHTHSQILTLSPRGGLPTRDELRAAQHPKAAALIAALDASGEPAAWPREPETCTLVEASIGAQPLDAVIPRVAAAIKASGIPWLGHHLAAIRGAAPPPKQKPRGMAIPDTDWTSEAATKL